MIDLYVEKQYISQMKAGNLRQFLMLYDGYFIDLYKYVARRLGVGEESSEVTRLTFLDALGQVQNTPEDGTYLIWLYRLAKNRVWERLRGPGIPQPAKVITVDDVTVDEEKQALISRFENMMQKLSMEEREILRLKFFEEVTDGDVMVIMEIDEGSIGSKIYRVLKRVHFLLFGESDERQGVYFGELTGFLARIRELEVIQTPEALNLSLRADLEARIDRRDFAVEADLEDEVTSETGRATAATTRSVPAETPAFISKGVNEEDEVLPTKPQGSNDPAKIFVEAVKEMREEEEKERLRQQEELERKEAVFDFVDRWKHVLIAIPVLIFVIVAGIIAFKYLDLSSLFPEDKPELVKRTYTNECGIKVNLDGDFGDGEIRSIYKGISDRLCGHFEVEHILIVKKDEGKMHVFVDIPGWFLGYRFAKKEDANLKGGHEWRIKQYARTFDRYQKYREV